MRKRKKSVLLFLVFVLILSGCGTKSDVITITNVSYDRQENFMNLIIRCLKNIIRRLITRKFR